MARYRVRDVEVLRKRMKASQRVVPHTVRSLAALVKVSSSTIGYLLTGERPVVDEGLAQRVSVALGCDLDDLFVPESSTFVNVTERRGEANHGAPG